MVRQCKISLQKNEDGRCEAGATANLELAG